MKKALVTGGCGFIGSNLTKELVKQGWQVDIVDDMSNGHLELLEGLKIRTLMNGSFYSAYKMQGLQRTQDEVLMIQDDFASDGILNGVHQGVYDVIFHQAAIPRVSYSVEQPFHSTDTNISKTVRLFEAARDKVDRIVWASSSSVYGGADILPTSESEPKNPKSPYAWQKSAIEDFTRIMCDLYEGTDVVCLRYFNVFGPGQFGGSPYSTAISAWCDAIKNKKQLRKDGTGEQSRDFSYIDNVVDANILAMKCDKKFVGECYNIACGDKISNNQILERFEEKFGDLDMRQAPFRPGDVMHTQADISKTSLDLGYKPTVKFWEGLEKTFEWWKL